MTPQEDALLAESPYAKEWRLKGFPGHYVPAHDGYGTTLHQQKRAQQQLPFIGETRPYTRPVHRGSSADVLFEDNVERLFEELEALLLSKHEDYGPSNIADSPGGPINGLRVRIWDKVARINHLLDNDRDPRHEALEDSFKDLANYAIIAMLVLRKQWPQS